MRQFSMRFQHSATPSLPFQRTNRSDTGSPEADVIDDSEPEREYRRQQEKEAKRQKKRLRSLPKLNIDVIELTDSDNTSPVVSPETAASVVSVIDITDSDSAQALTTAADYPSKVVLSAMSEVGHPIQIEDDVGGDYTSFPSIRTLLQLPRGEPCASTGVLCGKNYILDVVACQEPTASSFEPPRSQVSTHSDSEEDTGQRLKLGHFAYSNPASGSRAPSKPSSSPTESVLPVDSAGIAPTKKKAMRPATHRFSADFSDTELARLLKCVSCDIAWTTRKTVTEKMKHIQSCAKKHSLTDDTVRILLRKEVDSSPPVPSGKGKGKEKDTTPAESVDPQTLLGDVVQDVAKKKRKRSKVLETVKGVAETRDSILDRARRLIGGPGPAAEPTTNIRAGGHQGCVGAAGWVPAPTQAFSDSALLRQPSGSAEQHELDDEPPRTQAFAPSKFGAAETSALFGRPSRLADAFIPTTLDGGAEAPPPHFARSKLSCALDVPPTSPLRFSVNDVFPSQRTALPSLRASAYAIERVGSPVSLADGTSNQYDSTPYIDLNDGQDNYDINDDHKWECENWMYDDAYLEFEPEAPVAGPSQPSAVGAVFSGVDKNKTTKTKTVKKKLAKQPASPSALQRSSARSPVGTEAASAEPTAKSHPKKKADPTAKNTGTGEQELSDDDFNARMRDAVLKNTNLHLRVLRYEPVPFDEFLQLATEIVPVGRGQKGTLKARVRSFLDKQAIHFYGAEPTRSRTKRHK